MGELHTAWSYVSRHKIAVAVILLVLMVGFIDDNSLWQRRYRQKHIAELRDAIATQRERYARDSVALDKLQRDPEEAVRIAREDYYMVREDEDLFVVESPNDTLHANSR